MPRVIVAIFIATCLSCTTHVQRSDDTFDAIVANPMFHGGGPKVLFDDAHNNFHRSDGRYAPFVKLLQNDPITRGLHRIVTFGGQALRIDTAAEPLLRLSPDARIVKDLKQPTITEPAGANGAAAVALTRGQGRVVIMGEAAALTAQVLTGDPAKAFGVTELRVGMSRTDIDNKQFALNLARWLARSSDPQ